MAVVLDLLNERSRPRHPEKAHRADKPVLPKPSWIRVKAPGPGAFEETKKIVAAGGLHTVCQEASCPNIGECWAQRHATFLIMGDTCTRACAFCDVKTGLPVRSIRRTRKGRRRHRQARAQACGRHIGRPRRSRGRRCGAFRGNDPRHPAGEPRHHHRSAHAGFSAQGRCA
jgi:hypothetical protein